MTKLRAKEVERAMRLVWSSLESHLIFTHRKSTEGIKFHKKCVREYAELLDILSKLY